MRLLVIEDEPKLAELLARGLREERYAVDIAVDGEEAVYKGLNTSYDLVILDVLLPKLDGFEVLRRLRRSGRTLPVLMLTSRRRVDDRVTGLDAGADDYLTKPFEFSELFARVRALLRRPREVVSDVLRVEDLVLDPRTRRTERRGREIPLSAKEYGVLEYLMRRAGVVVARTELVEHVWDEHFDPWSNVVDVVICRLRAKVDRAAERSLIHTVRGAGYVISRKVPA